MAGFPAGTLTGAPKIRSIQLIRDLEPEGRGPYCGGVGWFGVNGDMDTGTVIRSIVLKDGIAHVQGGGGIVFDSIPEAEYHESLHKMQAPLRAIEAAESDAVAGELVRHATMVTV
jgi:anthranilate/para-aminobenzoate synthase component I